MDIIEFAEKMSPFPISPFQRQFLEKYEQATKEGKILYCI